MCTSRTIVSDVSSWRTLAIAAEAIDIGITPMTPKSAVARNEFDCDLLPNLCRQVDLGAAPVFVDETGALNLKERIGTVCHQYVRAIAEIKRARHDVADGIEDPDPKEWLGIGGVARRVLKNYGIPEGNSTYGGCDNETLGQKLASISIDRVTDSNRAGRSLSGSRYPDIRVYTGAYPRLMCSREGDCAGGDPRCQGSKIDGLTGKSAAGWRRKGPIRTLPLILVESGLQIPIAARRHGAKSELVFQRGVACQRRLTHEFLLFEFHVFR